MKIDIMHTLYSVSMIILAFISALVITKTVAKYTQKKDKEKKDEL